MGPPKTRSSLVVPIWDRAKTVFATRTPLSVVAQLAVICIVSFSVGFVLPAVAARVGGSYYEESGLHTIITKHKDIYKKYTVYKAGLDAGKKRIDEIDNRIASVSAGATGQVSELIRLRGAYQGEQKSTPHISIQPFDLHIISFFWPIMYACLCSVASILRPAPIPGQETRVLSRRTLQLSSGIFVFIFWAFWIRTLVDTSPERGRVVYAYSNPDVDPLSYIVQHLNFILYSFLLAVIWQQWASFILTRKEELRLQQSKGDANPLDRRTIQRLSDALVHWQIVFFVISVGFMIHTMIFWNQIIVRRDLRFLFEAIAIHSVWFMTVALTAAPLIMTWREWEFSRIQAIDKLISSGAETDKALDTKLDAIRNLRPVGSWNAAAMGATILTSFIIPVVQAFLKPH